MVQNSAPTEPPVPDKAPPLLHMMQMDLYTCIIASLLFLTFIIVITRFRLWYNNPILKKIPDLATNPVSALINTSIGLAVSYRQQNDLYLSWVVLLLIVFDNVYTVSSYSLLEEASERRSREYVFLYNCFITGYYIFLYEADGRGFYLPLLVIWSLVVIKFVIRIICYVLAEKAYGLENTSLIADYMKSEHKLTDTRSSIDPTCMKGYKYLVLGEANIQPKVEAPDYTPNIELAADVVTVERVWSCKVGLLEPSLDKHDHLKDVCLSFALFKLLRRRYFGYPAAEAQQDKTKQLIFGGLLTANLTEKGEVDKERVFRVVKMELGFLRDFFYTRYPVSFAMGFPEMNLALVVVKLGVTVWIAWEVLHNQNSTSYYLYFNGNNIDFGVTMALLVLLAVMEIFEAFTYIFCDWTKVILVCRNVRSHVSQVMSELASSEIRPPEANHWKFGYKVLAHFCKPRFSLSVKNRIGQYSLLHSCNEISLKRSRQWCSFISTCQVSKLREPPQRLKKSSVRLGMEVKNAIFDTLVQSQGHHTNGAAALQRNGVSVYEDLKWALNLGTPVHAIMVWHIATSFCATYLEKEMTSNKIVATHLSNYCAYLVAFLPDLLPFTNNNSVKYMFWEIIDETSKYFGKDCKPEEKCKKMMSYRGGGQKIIHHGSKLGQYLVENINDDAKRWKIMADFWSEFILYLAPHGSTRVHIKQLGNGSEFITHLWALLYHAGNIDTANAEYHP